MPTNDDVVQIPRSSPSTDTSWNDHAWDRADQVFTADFVFELGDPARPDLHGIADGLHHLYFTNEASALRASLDSVATRTQARAPRDF